MHRQQCQMLKRVIKHQKLSTEFGNLVRAIWGVREESRGEDNKLILSI